MPIKRNNPSELETSVGAYQPLAMRMRPRTIEEFVGQSHLLGTNKPLRKAIDQGILHSMVLWGPPGTGKTTLAQLMANKTAAKFLRLSAIFSGVKDIRQIVEAARELRAEKSQATILFVDEVHRFNKSQQDVFLPFVEDGTLIFIGATTENPSFELNSALLSRARVYVLKSLTEDDLLTILQSALQDKLRGYGELAIEFPLPLQKILVQAADGDARQVLNLLEILAELLQEHPEKIVTETLLTEVLQVNLRRFDKQGDAFYDQISALHKAVRGSSPDASLYWLCRMLDGGCDPRYIARRTIRMATEDIGLADPRALQFALHAADVYERLGSPEGELALAEAIIYMACAPKSNACYVAFGRAMRAAKEYGSQEVPLHLRNSTTKLMRDLDYGKNYRYAHDETAGYVAGENYFPEELVKAKVPLGFYQPVARGMEAKIAERLAYFKTLDAQVQKKK